VCEPIRATELIVDRRFCRCEQSPQGAACEARVTEHDGHYRVEYTPEEIGKYKVTCTFDGDSVKGFPATIEATPIGDASKCQMLSKSTHICFCLFETAALD
jgi:hypothetical protein